MRISVNEQEHKRVRDASYSCKWHQFPVCVRRIKINPDYSGERRVLVVENCKS